jgi:hypothetical protein
VRAQEEKGDGETMTMRRISVLLVAVVMMLTMAMGSALAHQSNNHKLCHVVNNGPDRTKTGLTHNQWKKELNRHEKDYPGKCDNDGGKRFNIARFAAGPF